MVIINSFKVKELNALLQILISISRNEYRIQRMDCSQQFGYITLKLVN